MVIIYDLLKYNVLIFLQLNLYKLKMKNDMAHLEKKGRKKRHGTLPLVTVTGVNYNCIHLNPP